MSLNFVPTKPYEPWSLNKFGFESFSPFNLQKNVHSTKFLKYLCANVVPTLGQISSTTGEDNGAGEGDSAGDAGKMTIQLDVLKLFAEMSTFSGELDKPEQDTQVVFDTLLVGGATVAGPTILL